MIQSVSNDGNAMNTFQMRGPSAQGDDLYQKVDSDGNVTVEEFQASLNTLLNAYTARYSME
jgi:hypothetical protein